MEIAQSVFADLARDAGALLVSATTEALCFGLLASPGSLGADVAVGEMQSFGNGLNFGGPGLGLPVARGIIIKHGGRLRVESPGHDPVKCPGSRFYINLPLQPPAFNQPTLAATPGSARPETKKDVTRGPTKSPFVDM